MVSSSLSVQSMSVLAGIGHIHNIPTMKFFTGISRKIHSKLYMLTLTAYVWDIRNNALMDTRLHAQFMEGSYELVRCCGVLLLTYSIHAVRKKYG